MSEQNEHLLENFRQSGVFKCFECIYCLPEREETGTGYSTAYRCIHDGVAVHSFGKDESTIMQGCACFWFEPMGKAGEAVARRQAGLYDALRTLLDFTWQQIPHSASGYENQLEKRYYEIRRNFRDLGVRV